MYACVSISTAWCKNVSTRHSSCFYTRLFLYLISRELFLYVILLDTIDNVLSHPVYPRIKRNCLVTVYFACFIGHSVDFVVWVNRSSHWRLSFFPWPLGRLCVFVTCVRMCAAIAFDLRPVSVLICGAGIPLFFSPVGLLLSLSLHSDIITITRQLSPLIAIATGGASFLPRFLEHVGTLRLWRRH